jgi:DNA-binding transcriptional LysR family regulator
MNIKHLSHIIAVAERGNFARAADQLNLSQPALSRSIQAAETEMGVRLFDRGGSVVIPTPACEFLLERARRLIFDSRSLQRDIELYRDGKLCDTAFGVGPFPADTFLAPLLVELRKSHPTIHLRVIVGGWELMADHLCNGALEFFVADIRDLPSDPDLLVTPLKRESGGFYVRPGHPAATTASIAMSDVWAYGVAAVRLPPAIQTTLSELLGIKPEDRIPIAVECDNVEVLKRIARVTDTVIAATHASAASDVEAGTLVALNVTGRPQLYADVGIVVMRGRSLSPMADLIVRRLPTLVET